MLVFRIIGKILSVPLILIIAIAAFLANAVTTLSGLVIIPVFLIVLGYDIYFMISMNWLHVFITSLIGAGLFLIYFGAAFIIAILEETRNGLIRFLHS